MRRQEHGRASSSPARRAEPWRRADHSRKTKTHRRFSECGRTMPGGTETSPAVSSGRLGDKVKEFIRLNNGDAGGTRTRSRWHRWCRDSMPPATGRRQRPWPCWMTSPRLPRFRSIRRWTKPWSRTIQTGDAAAAGAGERPVGQRRSRTACGWRGCWSRARQRTGSARR